MLKLVADNFEEKINNINDYNNIVALYIHGVEITNKYCQKIAEFLSKNIILNTLILSYCIFKSQSDINTIFNGIVNNKKNPLINIALNGNSIIKSKRGAIETIGNISLTESIVKILEKNVLKILYLTDYIFSNMNIFSDAIANNESLRQLFFDNIKIVDSKQSLAKNIAKMITNKTLGKIQCTKNYLGNDPHLELIFSAIAQNYTLEEIDLRNNDITDDGIKYLTKYIPEYHTISIINISENNITDMGGNAIAKALLYNRSIINIYTKENHISEEVEEKIQENLILDNKIERGKWEPMKMLMNKE